MQAIKTEGAFTHVVHDAPGCPHNHLHPAPKRADLTGVFLAAIDRQHLEPVQVRRIPLECFRHLDRELPCRGQHHDLHRFLVSQPG